MKNILFLIFFFLQTHCVLSQVVQSLHTGKNTSLRGLSVVDEKIFWASGSNGMVARTTDGGASFNWVSVAGFEKRDFRDIEAFDSNTAIIMAVSEPAIILKTTDGGKSWKNVFTDSTPGMFLDAMDFNGGRGVVVGDPIQGSVYIATTEDYGEHWQILKTADTCHAMNEGEAFFASSGSNVVVVKKSNRAYQPLFVSGGKISRLFIGQSCFQLPLQMGRNSTGANAMALSPSGNNGIIVGGDFANDKRSDSSSVLFNLGKSVMFSIPQRPLNGYKSSVVYISEKKLVACGTSGVDYSSDGGLSWRLTTDTGFHVVKSARKNKVVFLAGSNGRIAKLVL